MFVQGIFILILGILATLRDIRRGSGLTKDTSILPSAIVNFRLMGEDTTIETIHKMSLLFNRNKQDKCVCFFLVDTNFAVVCGAKRHRSGK